MDSMHREIEWQRASNWPATLHIKERRENFLQFRAALTFSKSSTLRTTKSHKTCFFYFFVSEWCNFLSINKGERFKNLQNKVRSAKTTKWRRISYVSRAERVNLVVTAEPQNNNKSQWCGLATMDDELCTRACRAHRYAKTPHTRWKM